jgi:hypothetical protein
MGYLQVTYSHGYRHDEVVNGSSQLNQEQSESSSSPFHLHSFPNPTTTSHSCTSTHSSTHTNPFQGLIAVNQDSLGKAATTFRPSGAAAPVSGQLYPYWAGPLSDGVVVALVAPNGAQTLSVKFADVPGLGSGDFAWTELLSGKTGTGSSVSASLGAHDIAVYKVVKN